VTRRTRVLGGVIVTLAVGGAVVAGTYALPRAAHPRAAGTASAGGACTPLPPGTRRMGSIDGRIPVVLHIPPHAVAGLALVLALPGAGQTASGFASYTGYSRLADERRFIVAYPTATGERPFWNISGTSAGKPDDVAYLRSVIAAALQVTCADRTRVGVTGVSNGGGMSARMACDAADLVSAAAPVAGGYGSLPDCHPSQPVAIMEIHGTNDRVVPYAGKGAGGFGAVPRFLAQWLRLDGCPRKSARRTPTPGVDELRWAPCSAGTAVVHERIRDADHGWPGMDDERGRNGFSSTAQTWAFLSAYRR
jgi:polyhydroxybutyrate depolymerase